MSNNKIYVGDVGTEIILDTGSDISTATVTQILWKSPKGKSGTWNAVLLKDDGEVYDPNVDSQVVTKIRYITKVNDIDVAGQWRLQAKIALPAWSGRGETAAFVVYDQME